MLKLVLALLAAFTLYTTAPVQAQTVVLDFQCDPTNGCDLGNDFPSISGSFSFGSED